MNNQAAGNSMKWTVAIATLLLLVSMIPVRVQAFGFDDIIDPFGLFEDDPVPVTNITNSNVNSPGGSVTVVNQTTTGGNNTATVNNNNGGSTSTGGTNNNNNDDDDDDHDHDDDDDDDDDWDDDDDDDDDDYYYGRLEANCYVSPTLAHVGERVTWRVSVWGGTGSYRYDWSGTNNLDGSGVSVTKRYTSEGTKTASVKITSGSRSIRVSCDNNVDVIDNDGYRYNDDYYNDDYYRNNLNVTCRPSTTHTEVGRVVTWSASATGGRGGYSYSWNGDDYLSGSGRALSVQYNSPGTKTAQVTVYSDGQSRTQSCGYVTIGGSAYNTGYYGGNLTVSCTADKSSASPYSPITWTASVAGGNGNYSYYWTGTDGLAGSQRVIATAYPYSGTKTATVTVTSAGQTSQASCSTNIKVASATKAKAKPAAATAVTVTPVPDQVASPLLSLNNIPWGLVALLVILVLLGTVIYLVFNKSKI